MEGVRVLEQRPKRVFATRECSYSSHRHYPHYHYPHRFAAARSSVVPKDLHATKGVRVLGAAAEVSLHRARAATAVIATTHTGALLPVGGLDRKPHADCMTETSRLTEPQKSRHPLRCAGTPPRRLAQRVDTDPGTRATLVQGVVTHNTRGAHRTTSATVVPRGARPPRAHTTATTTATPTAATPQAAALTVPPASTGQATIAILAQQVAIRNTPVVLAPTSAPVAPRDAILCTRGAPRTTSAANAPRGARPPRAQTMSTTTATMTAATPGM